jgi:hypothetical protein
MRSNTLPRNIALAAFALAQLAGPEALAEAAGAHNSKQVLVNAVKGPELKTYRFMVAGLDAFDANHALAPTAPEVRFRLRRLSGNQSADMHDLALRIAGNTISVPLPLAPDHSFSLPRNDLALSEDADLVLNKKRYEYRWDAVVSSPGIPATMRRLGDLRLECQVIVAVGKKELGLIKRGVLTTLLGGSDWCRTPKFTYTASSPRPIGSATLIVGERRIPLVVSDNGMSYTTPPEGEGHPDDALIDFTFADS